MPGIYLFTSFLPVTVEPFLCICLICLVIGIYCFVLMQSHANSCESLKIPCVHPECGMLVKKADLPEHLEKTCKCRRVNCSFCGRQINLNRLKVLIQHLMYLAIIFHLAVPVATSICPPAIHAGTVGSVTDVPRQFDVLCALPEYTCMAKWDLFALYIVLIPQPTKLE